MSGATNARSEQNSKSGQGEVLTKAKSAAGRLGLLFGVTWVMRLTTPVFTFHETPISWKDLILILGGLFLLYKAVKEMHHEMLLLDLYDCEQSDTHTDDRRTDEPWVRLLFRRRCAELAALLFH